MQGQLRQISELKIIAMNANSLQSDERKIDLINMIQNKKPDIVLISERGRYPIRFKIDGYKIYNEEDAKIKNTTAIIIKDTIKQTFRKQIETVAIQNTAINLHLTNNKQIVVISIYVPCKAPLADFQEDLTKLKKMLKHPNHLVIGGDFNARHQEWLNNINCAKGVALKKWLDENNDIEIIHPFTSTFKRSRSIIDFFLISKTLRNITTENHNAFCSTIPINSDHNGIVFDLKIPSQLKHQEINPIYVKNYKNVKWVSFWQHTKSEFEKIKIPTDRTLTIDEIDESIQILTSAINKTEQKFVKTVKITDNKYKNIPTTIKTLIKHKQHLRKKCYKILERTYNYYSEEYQATKSQLNCLTTIIRQQLHQHFENQIKDKLKTIKPGPKLYTEINLLSRRKNRKRNIILTNEDNTELITNTKEIISKFQNHIENVYADRTPHINPDTVNKIKTTIKNFEEEHNNTHIIQFSETNSALSELDNRFTTIKEIETIIKKLNSKKSAGVDNISNFIIKKCHKSIAKPITIIINNCLNNQYFPVKWKIALIHPIPKNNKARKPTEYRPISLLPNLGKILEIKIKQQIDTHCNQHKTIPEYQFGFRQGHSTIHPLLKLVEDARKAASRRRVTVACFMDIAKAFDSVWLEGLTYKLIKQKFSAQTIKIIRSFIKDRTFIVKINNQTSQTTNMMAGVAQGSVIGPILYNLYTADAPIDENNKCQILQYADDTLIYDTSSISPQLAGKHIETYAKTITNYYAEWGIAVNDEKTQIMTILPHISSRTKTASKQSKNLKIKINNTIIKPTNNIRYLGVLINYRLNYGRHIEKTLTAARNSYHSIRPLLRRKEGLSTETKTLLYKTLIRPIITYAYPVWMTAASSHLNKIVNFERRILRQCVGGHWDVFGEKYKTNKSLYEESGVNFILEHLWEIGEKTRGKLIDHSNPIVMAILDETSPDDQPTSTDQEEININTFKDARNKIKIYNPITFKAKKQTST